MSQYPREARSAEIKCVECHAPVDGEFVCVDCGAPPIWAGGDKRTLQAGNDD